MIESTNRECMDFCSTATMRDLDESEMEIASGGDNPFAERQHL